MVASDAKLTIEAYKLVLHYDQCPYHEMKRNIIETIVNELFGDGAEEMSMDALEGTRVEVMDLSRNKLRTSLGAVWTAIQKYFETDRTERVWCVGADGVMHIFRPPQKRSEPDKAKKTRQATDRHVQVAQHVCLAHVPLRGEVRDVLTALKDRCSKPEAQLAVQAAEDKLAENKGLYRYMVPTLLNAVTRCIKKVEQMEGAAIVKDADTVVRTIQRKIGDLEDLVGADNRGLIIQRLSNAGSSQDGSVISNRVYAYKNQKRVSQAGAVPEGEEEAMLRCEWMAKGVFPGSFRLIKEAMAAEGSTSHGSRPKKRKTNNGTSKDSREPSAGKSSSHSVTHVVEAEAMRAPLVDANVPRVRPSTPNARARSTRSKPSEKINKAIEFRRITEENVRKAYTALGTMDPYDADESDRILHRVKVLKDALEQWDAALEELDTEMAKTFGPEYQDTDECDIRESSREYLMQEAGGQLDSIIDTTYPAKGWQHMRLPLVHAKEKFFTEL